MEYVTHPFLHWLLDKAIPAPDTSKTEGVETSTDKTKDDEARQEAEDMLRRALEAREKALGLKHADTLICVSGLTSVLERQGKYEEAEAIHRRARE